MAEDGNEAGAGKPSRPRPVRPPSPGRPALPPKPSAVPAPTHAKLPSAGSAAPAGPSANVPPAVAAPRVRPAAPIRPTAPLPPVRSPVVEAPPPAAVEPPPSSEPEIFFDDDSVIVPVMDVSTFTPKKTTVKTAGSRSHRFLELKRTIIPILLVNTVALPVLSGLWFVSDPDAPIRATGTWLPIALSSTGFVTGLLAIVYILSVRKALKQVSGGR